MIQSTLSECARAAMPRPSHRLDPATNHQCLRHRAFYQVVLQVRDEFPISERASIPAKEMIGCVCEIFCENYRAGMMN
jgi:hypothetical protein